MRLRIGALLLFAIAATAAIALWRDPFLLVRGEFARQRIAAGLSRATIEVAGHRWVYAYREADAADAPTVVMLHGYTDEAKAVHGAFWGGVPLIQKPFTPAQLAERVRMAIDAPRVT